MLLHEATVYFRIDVSQPLPLGSFCFVKLVKHFTRPAEGTLALQLGGKIIKINRGDI